jgi:hypothetical protein
MADKISNPWAVTSIDSFNYLCCPECAFRSKKESSFQTHAVETHLNSKVFFNSEQREARELVISLFYYCPECVYKSEDLSEFQLHALENHPASLTFFSRDDSQSKNNFFARNPWDKDSIEDFQFFCCPLCPLTSRESSDCEIHILGEHLQSEKISIQCSEIKSDDDNFEEVSIEEFKVETIEFEPVDQVNSSVNIVNFKTVSYDTNEKSVKDFNISLKGAKKRNMRKCPVQQCTTFNERKGFYIIPEHPVRRQSWLDACKLPASIARSATICWRHFDLKNDFRIEITDEHINQGVFGQLKKDVVPSQNLPEDAIVAEPMSDFDFPKPIPVIKLRKRNRNEIKIDNAEVLPKRSKNDMKLNLVEDCPTDNTNDAKEYKGPEILKGKELKQPVKNKSLKIVRKNTIYATDENNVKKKLKIEDKSNKAPKIYTCSLCCHDFRTQKDLKMHNTMNKIYKCPVCSKDFCKQKALRVHQRTIHDGFNCELCGMVFDNLVELGKHKVKKHITSEECGICGKMIIKNLKRHIASVHSNIKPFSCGKPNCSFSANRKSNLDAHEANCKKKVDYICKICSKLFPSSNAHYESQYIKHYKAEHDEVPPEFKDKEQYLCSECPETFFKKSNFYMHKSNHKNTSKKLNIMKEKKDYTCEVCKRVFPKSNKHYESQYIKHYKADHNDIPPEFKDKEQYLCSECPEVFFDKNVFNAHVWNNHKNSSANSNPQNLMKKFECKTCHTTIFGRKNYVAHCKDVHNETISRSESIECHSCGEKFQAANFYIQHHQSVHGNLPPEYLDKELFVCDQCPQVFITKISLSMHIYNGHNAKNKLKKKEGKKCPYCEKSFQSRNNYLEHVKSKHEKKTPFQCDECDRSYATKKALTNHKQLVHQRVKCDECGKEICNSFILK